MSLQINNKQHLSHLEILTLSNARSNFSREIIVIDNQAPGRPKITTLSRSQISLWQLFLKLFNAGNLARYDLHLNTVSAHLNQYNWGAAVSESENTYLYQAYLTVCTLGNKCLIANKNDSLFKNASTVVVAKKIKFVQYRGEKKIHTLDVNKFIRWNPSLHVKHVKAQINGFTSPKIKFENAQNQTLSKDALVSRQGLEEMLITVTERLSEPKSKAPNPQQPAPTPNHKT